MLPSGQDVTSHNLVDYQLSVSQTLFVQLKQVKVHESHRRTIMIICLYLQMHELWIHPTESLICYHVTNYVGYQIQQHRHVECVTYFASFQQSETGFAVHTVQFLYNLQYVYGSSERTMSSYFKLLTSARRNLAPKVVLKHLLVAET